MNHCINNVFIEVLDEAGQRLSDPVGRATLVPDLALVGIALIA